MSVSIILLLAVQVYCSNPENNIKYARQFEAESWMREARCEHEFHKCIAAKGEDVCVKERDRED